MYPGDTYLRDPWTWVNYFTNPGPEFGEGGVCPPLPTFVFPDRKARSKVGIVFTPLFTLPSMPTVITLAGSHDGINWFYYPNFQVPATSSCFYYTVNTGPIIMLQMYFTYNGCVSFNVGVIPFGE